MGQPLTILYTDHGEGLGGAEYSLLDLMPALDPARYRAVLACAAGPLAEAARARGVTVAIMPFPRLRGALTAPVMLTRTAWQLASLARQLNARALHSNTFRASLATALAARLVGRPFIWHTRDIYGPGEVGGTWYPTLMCRLAQVRLANSGAAARSIPHLDVQVVYNGIDLAAFDPALPPEVARAQLGLPATPLLVGTVGRMQPWKGHHHFAQAAGALAARWPEAHFVVVGGQVFAANDDYAATLRAQVAALGLEGRFHFAGQQSNIPVWMAALDVFAHCSRAEPFGRVVVEAMAAARPVVAFADGGVPEIVVPGITGQLVPPGDVAALTHALAQLAEDPALRHQWGQAGRARAETHFSLTAHVRHIEAIYAHLLA